MMYQGVNVGGLEVYEVSQYDVSQLFDRLQPN